MLCLYILSLPVGAPGQPSISGVTSITATSISFYWSVSGDSVVTNSVVTWQVFNSDGGSRSGTSGNITSTSYTLQELESSMNYSITVTVTNAAGSTVSHPIIITTGKEESMYVVKFHITLGIVHIFERQVHRA